MLQLAVGDGVHYAQDVIPQHIAQDAITEIHATMEGKMINGKRRTNRYGSKTFGHHGEFEREEIPAPFKAVLDHITTQLQLTDCDYNQVEVLKLSTGTPYAFEIDSLQKTRGDHLIVNLDGICPLSIYSNHADGFVQSTARYQHDEVPQLVNTTTHSDGISTHSSNNIISTPSVSTQDGSTSTSTSRSPSPSTSPTGYSDITIQTPSLIISPPPSSVLQFSPEFKATYTKQIKGTTIKALRVPVVVSVLANSGEPSSSSSFPSTMTYDYAVKYTLPKSLRKQLNKLSSSSLAATSSADTAHDKVDGKSDSELKSKDNNDKVSDTDIQPIEPSEPTDMNKDETSTGGTVDHPEGKLSSRKQRKLLEQQSLHKQSEKIPQITLDLQSKQPITSLKRTENLMLIFRRFVEAIPLDEAATTQHAHGNDKRLQQIEKLKLKKEKREKVAPPVAVNLETCTDEQLSEFERTHVHQVYENIASHFSGTRYQAWPRVDEFLEGLPPYSILADVGCGNGKYLNVNPTLITFGSDISFNLLRHAYLRPVAPTLTPAIGAAGTVSTDDLGQSATAMVRNNVCLGDCLSVPFKDNIADNAISIAVIHHITTLSRRVQCINELLRIVKPGGSIMVTVWAKEQDGSINRVFNKSDVFVEFKTRQQQQQQQSKSPSEESNILCTDQDQGQDNAVTQTANPTDTTTTTTNGVSSNTPDTQPTQPPSVHGPAAGAMDLDVNTARFYHVFESGELEALVTHPDIQHPVKIEKSFYSKGNWCIIFTKLDQSS